MVKLNLEDKMRIVSGVNWWQTYEIKEYDFPSIFMCDGPHGLRKQSATDGDHLGLNKAQQAMCYPTESTIACSFDKNLLYKYGVVYGKEALSNEVDMILGPGVNVKRNPLCGRNFEYYSEDPIVSGKLGTEFVKGLQSVGVSCCVKHYVCNNIEYKRNYSDSRVNQRTLKEVYLKPFEIIVKNAQPASIMCSYNLINGVHAAENKYLLTDVLRKQFKFDGIVVSDWGAVTQLDRSIKAGLDLEMPHARGYERLKECLDDGSLKEKDLDEPSKRMVNFISNCKENRKNRDIYKFDRSEAENYCIEAERDSIVLLKNKNNIFPISLKDKLLIVGEIAKHPHYQGGGSSHTNDENAISLLNALDKNNVKYKYIDGYNLEKNSFDEIDVKGYDKVLFIVGNKEDEESEGYDRSTLSLPTCINDLIDKYAPLCKQACVLIFTGSTVTLPFLSKVDGIMQCGLPGSCGIYGVIDILLGNYCPSGKTTETWLIKDSDAYTYTKSKSKGLVVDYSEGVFVGYKYYQAKDIKVNFPFGYGLSYTKFKYSNFSLEQENDKYIVSCNIKNIGKIKGKETAFLFVRHPITAELRPIKSLLDFIKIELDVNEEKEISFEIFKNDLEVYDSDGNNYLPFGEYTFEIAASLYDIKGSLKAKIIGKQEKITLLTITRDLYEDDKKWAIFNEVIIKRVLPLYGVNQLPDATLKIILDQPLKSYRGLAPQVITDDVLNELLDKLNEVE